ncbi:hypothetical protein HMPREF9466_01175 [Fusobacterium necrophorum subsp. funduliforme 1_1_36S]|nr:hypothetical protein HMPREF9466_01175 [Fusobacterium necrophorum subsp. funduliforme 1_1_36S]
MEENKRVARKGGSIAGNARKEIEKETGKSVISSKNAVDLSRLIEDVVRKTPDKIKRRKTKE